MAALLYFLNSAATKNAYNNTFTNLLNSRGTIYGIYTGNGTTTNFYNNKIQNLNAIGATGTIYGINLSSSIGNGTMQVYNNMIGDLKTPNITSANAIVGINANPTGTLTVKLYHNTVSSAV